MVEHEQPQSEPRPQPRVPDEVRRHLHQARAEARAGWQAMLPPEFLQHRRAGTPRGAAGGAQPDRSRPEASGRGREELILPAFIRRRSSARADAGRGPHLVLHHPPAGGAHAAAWPPFKCSRSSSTWPATWREFIDQTHRAAAREARLVVFPEIALSGYVVTPDEADALAQSVPGPATQAVAKACAEDDVHVVLGMLERDADGTLFNTAVLLGPTGLLARYRKTHLAAPGRRSLSGRRRRLHLSGGHSGRPARLVDLLRPALPGALPRARSSRRAGDRIADRLARRRHSVSRIPRPQPRGREPDLLAGRRSLRRGGAARATWVAA